MKENHNTQKECLSLTACSITECQSFEAIQSTRKAFGKLCANKSAQLVSFQLVSNVVSTKIALSTKDSL